MNILLMTDGSESSLGAARFLARFPFTSKDTITIIHAIAAVPFDNRESYYARLREVREEIAPRILEITAAKLNGVKATITEEVIDGHPDDAILEWARRSDTDLVVLGGRGVQGITSLLIGSVTRSVSINSPKPVFIIKPPQWERSAPLKILYATDGSDAAAAAGNLLAAMPFPAGTGVSLLHVSLSAYMDIPERLTMEVDDQIKKIVAQTREAEYKVTEEVMKNARALLAGAYEKVVDVTRTGNPPEEILHTAKEIDADVIAVGSSGMRGVKGMLGSVSRNVLGHAE